MKKASELLTGIAVVFLGIALFGTGAYFLQEKMGFYTQSTQAEGIVIDIESRRHRSTTYYHPLISFESEDGNTYTFSSETGTSSGFDFNKGDKLMIRYIKEDPQMAKVDSFIELWGLPAALLVSGLLISLAGSYTCYNYFNKMKLRKELLKTGKLIQLPGRVESRKSKNKTEFVVVSEWLNPADSKMYTFTSDKISYDPASFLTDKLIDVWIDPMSPKNKHYVDISFLPEKG
ncbi:DUF3592 domain-containing protein [Reichenbachiella sp. MALMAid0571]|uniref:DUF3592 domain-containing protein n=1 Tax=Reichenbachiella sp. MALMAid0571 TaxID=3143939 RepID=UPI0032DE6C73